MQALELLATVLFLMAGYPCCCTRPPFPSPPAPGPWPYPGDDPDGCFCNVTIGTGDYSGCDPCPTISLQFGDDPITGDPLECPCSQNVTGDACLFSEDGLDFWEIGFAIDSGEGCTETDHRIRFYKDGTDISMAIDGVEVESVAADPWDCTSISYNFADAVDIDIGDGGYCQLVLATIAFGVGV